MNTPPPVPEGWDDRAYLLIRKLRDRLVFPLAASFGWLSLPAWGVSLGGVAAAASTVWTAGPAPRFALAGFALALGADALDGAVARRHGTASGRGKWVDHACDSATFALLVTAAATSGQTSALLAAGAAAASTLLVAAALVNARRRDPVSFRDHPKAGFLAHLPKLSFYVAFPLALAGGPRLVEPALLATTGLALGALPRFVFGR